MIKAVIFDIDNTLFDFVQMNDLSSKAAIDAMISAGLDISKKEALDRLRYLHSEVGLEDPQIDWYKITFPFNNKFGETTNKTTNKKDKTYEIIELLTHNPSLSILEIAEKLQITPYKVQYHLNKLKKQDRIKREGSKKTGKWVLK